MSKYATGKWAYGISDRSGFRYRLKDIFHRDSNLSFKLWRKNDFKQKENYIFSEHIKCLYWNK